MWVVLHLDNWNVSWTVFTDNFPEVSKLNKIDHTKYFREGISFWALIFALLKVVDQLALHKQWSFLLRTSLLNVTESAANWGLSIKYLRLNKPNIWSPFHSLLVRISAKQWRHQNNRSTLFCLTHLSPNQQR